jgi:hypothetical protein
MAPEKARASIVAFVRKQAAEADLDPLLWEQIPEEMISHCRGKLAELGYPQEQPLLVMSRDSKGLPTTFMTDRAAYGLLGDRMPLPLVLCGDLEANQTGGVELHLNGEYFSTGDMVPAAINVMLRLAPRLRASKLAATDPEWAPMVRDLRSRPCMEEAARCVHAGIDAEETALHLQEKGMQPAAAEVMASIMSLQRSANNRLTALLMIGAGAVITAVVLWLILAASKAGVGIRVRIGGLIFGPGLIISGCIKLFKAEPAKSEEDYVTLFETLINDQPEQTAG